MKLSIAVITMNRASQLSEALESCFACDLPKDTQFVIIDNASTDNTSETVKRLFDRTKYDYYYEKLSENLGVGGGRNYAFGMSKGEYVYFLDDDAFIDLSDGNLFFATAIELLDNHPSIISLTTQIYDNILQRNRNEDAPSHVLDEGLFECFMMCGGSHFLRKSFFHNNAPFFSNKYAYEEFLPSLRIADAGMFNAYCPSLNIIHNPLVDRWSNNPELSALGVATNYAIKSLCYPVVFRPLLYMAFWKRRRQYVAKEYRKKSKIIAKQIIDMYSIGDRIRIRTVINLLKKYGLLVF